MSLDYLKVKILSLTEESKIIRKMEEKRKRQAAWARDMVNLDRRVAWHECQVARLKRVIQEDNVDDIDVIAKRIQWHQLEIKRLRRQANKPISPDEVTSNEIVLYGLHMHRVNDVRKEARVALLAYGFLRGLKFRDMEHTSYSQPNWARIKVLVLKYGEYITDDIINRDARFEEWKKEALDGLKERYIDSVVPGSLRGQLWNAFRQVGKIFTEAR